MTANRKGALWAIGFAAGLMVLPAMAQQPAVADVIRTYGDIALAGYEDSLTTARALDGAIDALIAKPGEETLKAAREAYKAARMPYQQTEAYRFGNAVVDDWEGRVNAWPLDEGLIDYVDQGVYGAESDENALYTANVIANPRLLVAGEEVDASTITPELLANKLQEADGIEANVATGYHAIEFLLWGQDLNGTGPGAGNRPATDYDLTNCTNGNCDRRAQYLKAASTLLVADIEEMAASWKEGGAARKAAEEGGIAAILTGMGSLSYGELAGQRMKLGLLLHDPEEEHECFSDTTAAVYLYDVMGIRNVYVGSYRRIDGSEVKGASLSDYVAAADKGTDTELRGLLDATVKTFEGLKERSDTVEAYDQMIGEGNEAGNAAVQGGIDALIAQTRGIERVVALLNLGDVKIEDSDSLSNPDAVFQ